MGILQNMNTNDKNSEPSHFTDEEIALHDSIMPPGKRQALGELTPGLVESLARQNSRDNFVDDKKQRFTFDSISLNGTSEQMEKQMLEDVYALGGVALMGQSTVIYAGPNFGKTLIVLWLIIKAVEDGNFNSNDLMYINADDTHKGLTHKLKLAEKYGFRMAAPGYNNFRANNLVEMLRGFVLFDEARGKIVILDTLKKFTNLMDKTVGSEFGVVAREFTAKGGTLISLAHVNKHKNADGKSIMAGTTDISDDADCIYIGDTVSDADEKIVELRNTKDRGNVEKKISFSYNQTEKDYYKLLETVKSVGTDEAAEKRKAENKARYMKENIHIINYIKELIYTGVKSQKEIINLCNENHNFGKVKTHKLLNTLTGNNPDNGKLWKRISVKNNRYEYRLLTKHED